VSAGAVNPSNRIIESIPEAGIHDVSMKNSFMTAAVVVQWTWPAVMACSALSRNDKFVIAMTTATTAVGTALIRRRRQLRITTASTSSSSSSSVSVSPSSISCRWRLV